jgi:Rod binding domain-containing protein
LPQKQESAIEKRERLRKELAALEKEAEQEETVFMQTTLAQMEKMSPEVKQRFLQELSKNAAASGWTEAKQ